MEDFTIEGDKLHFSNVLHSMIDNAVKYCRDFPQVAVKTYRKGQNLIIDIADNGIGINPEHIGSVFQKFYRVPTGDKHDVKGFGLGLFYVHNICEAHGWQIKIKSDVGQGSTFSLIIPRLKTLQILSIRGKPMKNLLKTFQNTANQLLNQR